MTRLRILAIAATLCPGTAAAGLVDATYCVDWNVDYDDGATGDYYTGSDGPARGVKLKFAATGAATTTWYTDYNGSDPGCIEMTIDDQYSWTVSIVADAYVNGNYVRVLDGIGGSPKETVWLTGHTPADSTGYQTNVGPGKNANIMGVASYAMYRSHAGLSGETFDFVAKDCNMPGEAGTDIPSSCFRPDLDEIRISSTYSHWDYKFIIAHEMGHAVAWFSNEEDGWLVEYDANRGDCGPSYANDVHDFPTKEFSSAGATEGFGLFWAAVALNDDGYLEDCEFQSPPGAPDWNQSGDVDTEDVDIFSCSDEIIVDSVTVVEEYDYFGQYCDAAGATQNRSTEYDWLRALWDARTQGSMSTATIFDIVNHADPNDWEADGIGSGGDYPAARMSSGAYAVGSTPVQASWDVWAALNGIDR